MSYHRQTLLAGIAAFALVAGTGLASAQESSTQQSKQPRATQQINQPPAAGKIGQSAQDQNHGPATHQPKQRSEEINRANKADKAATDESRKAGAKAARDETKAGKSGNDREDSAAAQREGSQRAQLTEEQRRRIRSTVINAAGAPRIASVDFDVTVGTVIPRGRIHIVPVPETLVQVEPEWRGFLYFVYADQVVIVNPRDMRIVALVPA